MLLNGNVTCKIFCMWHFHLIDSDSIKLNILINEMIKPEPDVVPGYRIWSVFSLPKNKNVIIQINGKDITE
ncbi:Uncharacterised protein [Mycoplasmopsis bovirhinis]|uniref:Uncharacterized protein n=2 Tax=Mycoplasmopsis bovirhinis TaxID=29553 RepID=A0A449ACE1_9BACT|nr:Uncharacterised protein [Mycoplasmopsis bovirhinis]